MGRSRSLLPMRQSAGALPDLSVVIPVLNEAATLPRLLDQLAAQRGVQLEVLVVDGGSSDGTPGAARDAGAQVLRAPPHRAGQMNAGAQAAHGSTLLFLHADSHLPSDHLLGEALHAYRQACRIDARVAGHFGVAFLRSAPGHERLYRFLEGKSRLNRPGTIHGDQGLLIGRAYFEELGGFDHRLPVMEDERLSARVFATGRWILLPGEMGTSARRFETEGPRARYILMALMMGLHAAGLEDFFNEARRAYAKQSEAARLDLRPFLRLIRRLLRRRGWREGLGIIWRCARYVRGNAWQLAYLYGLERGRPQALDRFDRRIAPLLANPAVDALAAVLVLFWFFCWLPLTARR